jgi:predicted hydrocarbon binding protein
MISKAIEDYEKFLELWKDTDPGILMVLWDQTFKTFII